MTLAEEYPELRDYLSDDDDQEPDFEVMWKRGSHRCRCCHPC